MLRIFKLVLAVLMTFSLFACATMPAGVKSPAVASELAQGKRDFESGYYKRAMHLMLPLACDGVPEAQYAVGYMYYYGYGVAQDTDVGYFWIKRSADKGYMPAVKALQVMDGAPERASELKFR